MNPVIYLVNNRIPIDSSSFRYLLQFVPLEKQKRILRQRIKQNADNMLIGAVLAKHMIFKVFHIPISEHHIQYGPYGKPFLQSYPNVHFNISHSGQYVVCAVYDSPIGIDIQTITPYRADIAKRVCTSSEVVQINNCDDPHTEFTKIWTQKEAYLKMLGYGLSGKIFAVQVSQLSKLQTLETKDFIISYAVQ